MSEHLHGRFDETSVFARVPFDQVDSAQSGHTASLGVHFRTLLRLNSAWEVGPVRSSPLDSFLVLSEVVWANSRCAFHLQFAAWTLSHLGHWDFDFCERKKAQELVF